jgi:hypothetical protein
MLIGGVLTVIDLKSYASDDASESHLALASVPNLSVAEGENSALSVGFFLELLLQALARPLAPFF